MNVYNASSFLTEAQILSTKKSKAATIIYLLEEKGNSARIVGGAVRDMILGIATFDFDVATDAAPDTVLEILQANNIYCLTFGMQFGTIVAILEGQKVEITTLREDVKCFGRYAQVSFTKDYKLDAKRRDFTVNSLNYCIIDQKIFDYCSGIQDIFDKKVKFIGDTELRIKEDYLRIMRFFRFSSIYAKNFDKNALRACLKNQHNMISNVDIARIIKELNIILTKDTDPSKVLNMLYRLQTLNLIFDGLQIWSIDSVKRLINFLNINIVKNYEILDFRASMLYAALMFDNRSEELIKQLKQKKFPNSQINQIVSFATFAKTCNIKSNASYKKTFQNIFLQLWYKKDCFNETVCYIIFASVMSKIDFAAILECLAFFSKKKKLPMPIQASEVAIQAKQKKDISALLAKLEEMWLSTNFSASREKLLLYLQSLVRE